MSQILLFSCAIHRKIQENRQYNLQPDSEHLLRYLSLMFRNGRRRAVARKMRRRRPMRPVLALTMNPALDRPPAEHAAEQHKLRCETPGKTLVEAA